MKKIFVIAALLTVFFTFTTTIFAEVPEKIRYNGRLKGYQTPVDGRKTIKFVYYTALSGGSYLGEETHNNVQVSSGIFSLELAPKINWNEKEVWMQIVIDGAEFTPRERLLSQPYAVLSKSSENLLSDKDIKVTVSSKSAVIGVNGSGEVYSKVTSTAPQEYYMVPKGAIIMWSGSKVPDGWVLCAGGKTKDGAVIPDLRGKFVIGASTVNVTDANGEARKFSLGSSSGTYSHKLTVNEMPKHSHDFRWGQVAGASISTDVTGYTNTEYSKYKKGLNNIDFSGGNVAHNNLPPYYVLCFIMKE